jgi:hypothetical protein
MDLRKPLCLAAFFLGVAAMALHVGRGAADPDYLFGCLSATVLATWALWTLRRS